MKDGEVEFESRGGTLGANYSNWQMPDLVTSASYVPLSVELRGIHELMWPEMMGVTDPVEANRIHALRVKTSEMLDRYTANIPVDNSDWNPRIYRAKYDEIKIDKSDDEGNDDDTEWYGDAVIRKNDKGESKLYVVSTKSISAKSLPVNSDLLGKSKSRVSYICLLYTSPSPRDRG